jgi:hypothetical protein
MIRILAIKVFNRILILIILMIKSLLNKLMVCLDNLEPCSECRELNKVENRCSRGLYSVVFGSNLDYDTGHPKLVFLSSVPSGNCWDSTSIIPRQLPSNFSAIQH